MIIWKKGDKKVSCMIEPQEIQSMGFTLEELNQSKEKTEEFLSLILEQAKDAVGINTENGIQEYEASILPNKTMLLSISCDDEEDEESEKEELPTDYQITFQDLDHAINFAGYYGENPKITSSLYKKENRFYLIGEFSEQKVDWEIARYLMTAEEFGGTCDGNPFVNSFLREHGTCILAQNALKILKDM